MMETVTHLWNVIRTLSQIDGSEANTLRTHYVECCRRLGVAVELPTQIFGPNAMCAHCGSLWSRTEHKIRLKEGRHCSKSVLKLIEKSKATEQKLHRTKETLIKKSLKNRGNKLIISCSFCSRDTKINLNKPQRQKPTKLDTPAPLKKRKKRTKDKTAGLIIRPVPTAIRAHVPGMVLTTATNTTSKLQPNRKTPSKPRNLNKLGALINKKVTPSKKSVLHDFITGLS